ncbi:hypothetical protein BDZ90DRAFT_257100 [Jaminaea rosea]|uniref:Uncharacterized protein n=1 Tax=Jaminaea rosea TaxID=1569628 RepID=A0A316V0B2_9BASI|nr:hypothetical protein BDZ90DRAFT_257100 [Jaminaea rosea]PWN29991.1 hypothetical protein BDZ90DRAFT_257100 [Jaminaea rosea]
MPPVKMLSFRLYLFFMLAFLSITTLGSFDLVKRHCGTCYHDILVVGPVKEWHVDPQPGHYGYEGAICTGNGYGFGPCKFRVQGDFIARINVQCTNGKGGLIDLDFKKQGCSDARPQGKIKGRFDGPVDKKNVGYIVECW